MKRNKNISKKLQTLAKKQIVDGCISLTMICYNEEKIIGRFLQSLIPLRPALCALVVVTNSTDNTIPIMQKWCTEQKLKFYYKYQDFKDFASQRQSSLDLSREKVPQAKYDLTLDADHCLVVTNYNKFLLELTQGDCLALKEVMPNNEGMNRRIFSRKYTFECWVGTHELWVCMSPYCVYYHVESIHISDQSDGGSHDVKFSRDVNILLNELEKIKQWEKDNSQTKEKMDVYRHRTNFYLARSYYGLQEYENAIKYYLLRTTMSGYEEEIYISYWNAGQSYENLAYMHRDLLPSFLKGFASDSCTRKMKKLNIKFTDYNYVTLLQKTCHLFQEACNMYNKATIYRPQRIEAMYSHMILYRSLLYYYDALLIGEEARLINKPKDFFLVNTLLYDYYFDFELSSLAEFSQDPLIRTVSLKARKRLAKRQKELKLNKLHY
jgi:glycosyltransferase involved in cell wall biosynthesis